VLDKGFLTQHAREKETNSLKTMHEEEAEVTE
jgi:hypothetical protein